MYDGMYVETPGSVVTGSDSSDSGGCTVVYAGMLGPLLYSLMDICGDCDARNPLIALCTRADAFDSLRAMSLCRLSCRCSAVSVGCGGLDVMERESKEDVLSPPSEAGPIE